MFALVVLLGAGFTALEAWAAMLIIGAIHSSVPEVPTFGYGAAIWLVVLANVLVGGATAAGNKAA